MKKCVIVVVIFYVITIGPQKRVYFLPFRI